METIENYKQFNYCYLELLEAMHVCLDEKLKEALNAEEVSLSYNALLTSQVMFKKNFESNYACLNLLEQRLLEASILGEILRWKEDYATISNET